jgi:hypothetical protein
MTNVAHRHRIAQNAGVLITLIVALFGRRVSYDASLMDWHRLKPNEIAKRSRVCR